MSASFRCSLMFFDLVLLNLHDDPLEIFVCSRFQYFTRLMSIYERPTRSNVIFILKKYYSVEYMYKTQHIFIFYTLRSKHGNIYINAGKGVSRHLVIIFICLCMHMYVYIRICMSCIYIHAIPVARAHIIYIYIHNQINTMHIYKCIHIYTYIYIYIYIYIYNRIFERFIHHIYIISCAQAQRKKAIERIYILGFWDVATEEFTAR